jgi:hypothetical protein
MVLGALWQKGKCPFFCCALMEEEMSFYDSWHIFSLYQPWVELA